VAKLVFAIAGVALSVAVSLAADARSHRRPAKPAVQAPQDDKSSVDKASADIDKAMNRSLKGICRGC
jgi:hypothetical protein